MPHVIYRKSDRLYAGICWPPQPLATEINNVCNSELGGVPDDYAAVEVANIPRGYIPVISESGEVTFTENLKLVARREAKTAAVAKLKALGLTDDEINALASG